MIKKGDTVYVIAGNHRAKGQKARVSKFVPSSSRVFLEPVEATEPKSFINPVKKFVKKTQEKPEGSIETIEASIHVSNVMLASNYESSRRVVKSEAKPVKAVKAKKTK
jgi:large subunit ribosomal protein L24